MFLFAKKHNLSIIFISILFIGLLLRILPAFQNSFPYTYDVGRDLLELRNIVQNFDIPFIGPTTGLKGLFYGPWWYYFLLPAFLLSDGNPQGLVIYIALTGTITIIIAYKIGRLINDSMLGIVFASFVSFSPATISLSSQIWNPNIAPLWIILIIFLLLKMLDLARTGDYAGKRYLIPFLLGLLLALSIDAEVVYGLLLSAAIATSFFLLLRKMINIKVIICIFLGYITILIPRILFELNNNFLMTRTIFTFASGDSDKTFSLNISENIINRLQFLFHNFGDSIKINNLSISVSIAVLCSIIILLFWKGMNLKEKFMLQVCAVIFVTYYIGLTLFQQDIWPHYIAGLPIIFLLVLSISTNSLLSNINKQQVKIISLIILFTILINPINLYNQIFVNEKGKDVAIYSNHLEIIDFIYFTANGENFKYITYTPPVHDYTYRYLFEWYGMKKYGYSPNEANGKLFFLILEPDYEDKSRLEKWLAVRSGDGVIKKEQTFSSGVRVQIREKN